MFEFLKLCKRFEKTSALERAALLAEKSVKVIAELHKLDMPGVDPVNVLAAFLIGSVVCDGSVNEMEYLLIYPSLLRIFGEDFDYASVKATFGKGAKGKQAVKEYTEEMEQIFAMLSEDVRRDLFALCMCAVSIDGKISLKERIYLRRLASAK